MLKKLFVPLSAASLLAFAAVTPASAGSTSTLIYQYSFAGEPGASISNTAGVAPYDGMSLAFYEASSPSGQTCYTENPTYTEFTGNGGSAPNCESVAWAEPPTGDDSLNVLSDQGVGMETQFIYQAQSNPSCNSTDDPTPNVSQIGRSGSSSVGEIKLQLSNCIPGDPAYMECVIVGASTGGVVITKLSSFDLIATHTYEASCAQAPLSDGDSKIELNLDDETTGDTYSATPTVVSGGIGSMTSTLATSFANQYKPASDLSENEDQYNGGIVDSATCLGAAGVNSTFSSIFSCLSSSV
jgi:hypothetical protein